MPRLTLCPEFPWLDRRNWPNVGNTFCRATEARNVRLFAEKILDHLRHALDLRVGQFGINRQAQAFARGLFGDGKIAGLVAEVRVSLLQMQRQWDNAIAQPTPLASRCFFNSSRRGWRTT